MNKQICSKDVDTEASAPESNLSIQFLQEIDIIPRGKTIKQTKPNHQLHTCFGGSNSCVIVNAQLSAALLSIPM